MVLQNIWIRAVGDVLTDVCPSDIFPAGFYQNVEAVLATRRFRRFKKILHPYALDEHSFSIGKD